MNKSICIKTNTEYENSGLYPDLCYYHYSLSNRDYKSINDLKYDLINNRICKASINHVKALIKNA